MSESVLRDFVGRPAQAMTMAAATLCLAALFACGGTSAGPIHVGSATYGANCGAPAGNATEDLKAKCDGQQTCDYVIDVRTFGDPKAGCSKDYSARWTCGTGAEVHEAKVDAEAGFGKHVEIVCPAAK